MTTFFLICDEDEGRRQCAMQDVASLHLEIPDEQVFVGRASPITPASERPVLQHVLSRLWPGDLLVIHVLASLGNGCAEVLNTLQTIQAKRASVACIYSRDGNTAVIEGEALITTLSQVLELNHRVRTLRACEAAQQMKRVGARVGRPCSLDPGSRRKALEALAAGGTVTEVARLLGTSRHTIRRLRASDGKE